MHSVSYSLFPSNISTFGRCSFAECSVSYTGSAWASPCVDCRMPRPPDLCAVDLPPCYGPPWGLWCVDTVPWHTHDPSLHPRHCG